MSSLRTFSCVILAAVFLSAAPALAQSTGSGSGGTCSTCGGTKVDNNIVVNIDLTGLTDTFNKVIDALVKLGMKPTYVNGNYYFNNGIINNGAWNSGTMKNSMQNTGVYNTGNNNMIKLLAGGRGGAGGGGGIGGGFSPCGNGAVCGRRW